MKRVELSRMIECGDYPSRLLSHHSSNALHNLKDRPSCIAIIVAGIVNTGQGRLKPVQAEILGRGESSLSSQLDA
jgi:hypothetical protein